MLLSRKRREIYRLYAEEEFLNAEERLLDFDLTEEPRTGRRIHKGEPPEPRPERKRVGLGPVTAPLARGDALGAGPRGRPARSIARISAFTLMASAVGLSVGLLVVALLHRLEHPSTPGALSSRRATTAPALAAGPVHAARTPRTARRASVSASGRRNHAPGRPRRTVPRGRAPSTLEASRLLPTSAAEGVEAAALASVQPPSPGEISAAPEVRAATASAASSAAAHVVSSPPPAQSTQAAPAHREAGGTAPREPQAGAEFGFER
jgi:hypothetical protein